MFDKISLERAASEKAAAAAGNVTLLELGAHGGTNSGVGSPQLQGHDSGRRRSWYRSLLSFNCCVFLSPPPLLLEILVLGVWRLSWHTTRKDVAGAPPAGQAVSHYL
jgi:hypothetical protein